MRAPTELQKDALCELANIGAGSAANTLSRLMGGRPVRIDVPQFALAQPAQLTTLLGGPGKRVMVAEFSIEGGIDGMLWWVLPFEDARRLGGTLLKKSTTKSHFSHDEVGALAEAANIVASACLSAVGQMVGMNLLPSPPDVADGDMGTLLKSSGTHRFVALHSGFHSTDEPLFHGHLLYLLMPSSLKQVFKKLSLQT
jgi:chemotaxis protein CheC